MDGEINDETRDTAAAVQAGRESASAEERTFHLEVLGQTIPIAVNGTQVVVLHDAIKQAEQLGPAPLRRALGLNFTEVKSFNAYVSTYKHPKRTLIYADVTAKKLTAVFDDYELGAAEGLGGAGWRQHRATYTCPLSPEWKLFCSTAGRALGQMEFGDFIEANMEYLTSADGFPAPGDVLLMARSLVINTKGTFTRKVDVTSGNGTLICETDHGPESTKIPRAFLLALRVFEGGEAYQVEARLRFTMKENVPSFTFTLHRVAEWEAKAFDDVREQVETGTGVLVLAGTPG